MKRQRRSRRSVSPRETEVVQALVQAGLAWLPPMDPDYVKKTSRPAAAVVRYRTVVCALAAQLTSAKRADLARMTGFGRTLLNGAIARMPELLAESVEARRMAAVLGSEFCVPFPDDWPPCGIVLVDAPVMAELPSEVTIQRIEGIKRIVTEALTEDAAAWTSAQQQMLGRWLTCVLVRTNTDVSAMELVAVMRLDLSTVSRAAAQLAEALKTSWTLRRATALACSQLAFTLPEDYPDCSVNEPAPESSADQWATIWTADERQAFQKAEECFRLVASTAGLGAEQSDLRQLSTSLGLPERQLAIVLAAEFAGLNSFAMARLLGYSNPRVLQKAQAAMPRHLTASVALGNVATTVVRQLQIDLPVGWDEAMAEAQAIIGRLWQIFDHVGQAVGLSGRDLATVSTGRGPFNKYRKLAAALAAQLPDIPARRVGPEIGFHHLYVMSVLGDMPRLLADSAEMRRLAREVADRYQLRVPDDWPLSD